MAFVFARSGFKVLAGAAVLLAAVAPAQAQSKRGRNYRPLQPAAKITVTVERAKDGKPISNAAVVFRATREGKSEGSLEIKSNPDGQASIDVIEVGSHVSVQVIADGFATNSAEFDVPTDVKDYTIKMERPRAQVSSYTDTDGKPAQLPPGVQEPRHIARPPKTNNPAALAEPNKQVSPNDPAYQLGAKPEDRPADPTSPTTGSPDSSQSPVKANPSATGTPAKNLPGSVTTPLSDPKPDTKTPPSTPQ